MKNERQYITGGEGLPKWNNPISHAVVVNNMCFVSGQLSVNEDGHYEPGTTYNEAKQAFHNFFAAIRNAGFHKSDIVFIDIALDNLKDLSEVDQLFMELFPEGKRPARTVYQVEALPFAGKVKVRGNAVKSPTP